MNSSQVMDISNDDMFKNKSKLRNITHKSGFGEIEPDQDVQPGMGESSFVKSRTQLIGIKKNKGSPTNEDFWSVPEDKNIAFLKDFDS